MLELVNVKKTYVTKAGDTVALNGVSLKFAEKGLVFITGKSGCGKTTLLNVIGGLDNLDSGDIIVDGKKFSEFSPADYDSYRNTLVGFVFQEYNLLSEYTIEKNIDIANELQGREPDQKQIEELLKTVEIGGYENRKPNQLSGGQKQRVAIARALIKNPKIVLADEPTGALDSATGIQVMELLKKLSKDKLIIVVSHELEFAEKYADRIIKIVDGKVVDDLTLNDVEVKTNVFDAKEEVVVKSGTKLTNEEAERLLTALEQNRKINITEKIIARQKEKTGEIKIENSDKAEFIKSKMKFKSVAGLGAKSLVVKPIRLALTILLSVIAFAVFGVFDSVASYNGERALINMLKTTENSAVSIAALYNEDEASTKLKFSQSYLNSLNDKTGYSFRGVYDINDLDRITNNNRTYHNRAYNLDDLYIKASTQVNSREYYYRTVNGIVEFKPSEISGNKLAPNEFNYTILYGKYPVLATKDGEAQELGISKYIADCIMYWLDKKDTPTFGDKIIDEIEDLIGTRLVIENIEREFVISAIIDCGTIPEKYDKLKKIEGDYPHNLIRDYSTYLNSSCNLMLFAPEGYVAKIREQNNRVTSYVSKYYNLKYKGRLTSEDNMSYIYYNQNDFDTSNSILFNDLYKNTQASMPNLAEDEILISVNNLKIFFEKDRGEALKKDQTKNYASEIDKQISLAEDPSLTIEERRSAVNELLNILKIIYYNDNYNIVDGHSKYIVINIYDNYGNLLTEMDAKKVKVVGVYLDVNIDEEVSLATKGDYYPFVLSTAGLNRLNINTNQGIYSRAISGTDVSNRGARILGKMMSETDGYVISWYQNGILDVLDENAEFLNQFLDLFLYVAIVIVLFSVFMLMNYITTSIVSKRQSIGVLRALGTRGKSIFEMFLIESLIIAVMNGIIACGVGYIASIIVNNYLLNVMNLTIRFALFGGRQIIIILISSIVTGVLASLIPIIKIVKEKPVALIRKEQ